MKFRFALVNILISLVTFGCKKDGSEFISHVELLTKKDQLIEQEFTGYWYLISIHSDQPVDVNLDGIKSTDLMEEIPYHAYVTAQIKVNWGAPADQRRVFSDGYVRTYLENEDGSGTNRYVVNGRTLFFDMDERRTRLTLTDGKKIQTHRMQVNSKGQLMVDGIERSYFTKGGWITLPTISTYERTK